MKRLALAALFLGTVSCSTRAPSRIVYETPERDAGNLVRVALVTADPRISASGDFVWYEENGRTPIAQGRRGEEWHVERSGARVRAVRQDGAATPWQRAGQGIVARTSRSGEVVAVDGRRYRGDLFVAADGDGLLVVNRVGLEDYLRGVVAVEMGKRPLRDSAALQAQAVASRSFVLVRMDGASQRLWDVRASTADQAYGGVEAENSAANAAIAATRGLVLKYNGRVVDALYSSTCGGSTAEADEVWNTPSVPYLQRVSDRIGDSERFYCDIAPRYRWTRDFTSDQLNTVLQRYLAQYASVPGGNPGDATALTVRSQTASGRVGVLDVVTDRGTFSLKGNDIRYVLRSPGGEMLSSTYFSVEPSVRDGRLVHVTLRGRGYGHGVGMCQWGAIGRARAGQSFRTILGTYYPGTTIGAVQ